MNKGPVIRSTLPLSVRRGGEVEGKIIHFSVALEVIVNASNNATTFNEGNQVMLTCNLDTGGAPPTAVMWT